MPPRIKTTAVGSYPVPSWMIGNTSRLVLRDAVMAVLKTQELAGLDVVTDGELMRFDPSHPETNGMVDYFASQMQGIRKEFTLSDFDRFRADRAPGFRLLTAGMAVGKIGTGYGQHQFLLRVSPCNLISQTLGSMRQFRREVSAA